MTKAGNANFALGQVKIGIQWKSQNVNSANDNFQSETITKLKSARLAKQLVESKDDKIVHSPVTILNWFQDC